MGWIRKGEKHGALLHKNDSEESKRVAAARTATRVSRVWDSVSVRVRVGSLTVGSPTGGVEMDVHRVISASIEPASREERPPRGVDCCVVGRWWPRKDVPMR